MITISRVPFHQKLTQMFYEKAWRENNEYLEKHGKGPYEFEDGRDANRTRPYLDSAYYMKYDKWLKDEFNITHHNVKDNLYTFETQEEATWFVLRYS